MATARVLVSPGMLPPTISTTPNSPSVWANVKTTAVNTPGHTSGNSTRQNACQVDMPQQAAASRQSWCSFSNTRCMGCTANGTFTSTDATHNPAKLNTRGCPNQLVNHWPSQLCCPNTTSK